MTPTEYPHIFINEKGVPCLNGTRLRVQDVAAEFTFWRFTPERIQDGHDDQSLAAIYSALAYYFDHEGEIETAWEEAKRVADELQPLLDNQALKEKAQRLKALLAAEQVP